MKQIQEILQGWKEELDLRGVGVHVDVTIKQPWVRLRCPPKLCPHLSDSRPGLLWDTPLMCFFESFMRLLTKGCMKKYGVLRKSHNQKFAIDNFNAGNETHSIQNKMRLKYVTSCPAIGKKSIEDQKQRKGNINTFRLYNALRSVWLADGFKDEDNQEDEVRDDVSVLKSLALYLLVMSDDAWTVLMAKIEQCRKKIPASQRLFELSYIQSYAKQRFCPPSFLNYNIVDHWAARTNDDAMNPLRASLPKEIDFSLPVLSGQEGELLDMLVTVCYPISSINSVLGDGVENVRAETPE
ncbi:hypothetical protein G9A89_002285 [Geosiphon pyriformis]|nr:hypothetical protein G9A89_002285 [Geosiphon pyriformis]